MCGIAGLLGVPLEKAGPAATRMLRAMQHRGPDDTGLEVVPDPRRASPPAVLAHVRLAILDPSAAGHQPMADNPPSRGAEATPLAGPANWIVYNGEVFNSPEL